MSNTVTPNVVIEDSGTRRKLNIIVSVALIIVGTATAVDGAAPQFDWSAYTTPAFVGLSYLAAAFNLAVSLPNTPK